MQKILSINGTSFYSTGNIIKTLEEGLKNSYNFIRATADFKGENCYEISGSHLVRQSGKIPAQLFGNDGFEYRIETRRMLKWIAQEKPDLIHIHNVHGYYTNVRLILDYAFDNGVPIVYTMHDCWTFTGRCAYFDSVNCLKWKSGCGRCQYKKLYPKTRLFDFSGKQWLAKKDLFTGHNIRFVCPSEWLANLAKQSFLKNEQITVINNAIDVDFFAKRKNVVLPSEIDVRKRIILSVAYPFTKEKGLLDLNKLQKMIKDDNKYQIVAVGITDEDYTEPGIIRVPPTKDRDFLAGLYQVAYVFCFFSYQDNYPTVLLESLASSTPIITYKVGGCPEIAINGITGFVVDVGDVFSARQFLDKISEISRETCRSIGMKHSREIFVNQYHDIYKELIGS